MSILEIIEEIRSVSSTKGKVATLEKYKDTPYLKEILYYALSKRKKYYIKNINAEPILGIPSKSYADMLALLDMLSTGEYRGFEGEYMIKDLMKTLSNDDRELFKRIIDRNLRFDMGSSLINKVYDKLIEKTPYMGCTAYSKAGVVKLFQTAPNVISEVKMDGQYCNVLISGGLVTMESRQGEDVVLGDCKLLRELSTIQFDDIVLNGELTIDGESNRHIANGIIRSLVDLYTKKSSRDEKEHLKHYNKFVKEKGAAPEDFLDRIVYTCWDVITHTEYNAKTSTTPRSLRLEKVADIIDDYELDSVRLIEHRIVDTLEEALSHYKEVTQSGGEGTVLKDNSGIWKNGKPTFQYKLKLEMTLDLRVIGFRTGNFSNEGIVSSIEVESEDGLLKTVPTGIDQAMMAEITANQDKYMGKILEMKCNGISQNSKGEYSTAHPAFICFREDKDTANTLQECLDIMNSAIDG